MEEPITKKLVKSASCQNVSNRCQQCYEHRRFKNALCPSSAELDGFKGFMDSFYEVSRYPSCVHHLLCEN